MNDDSCESVREILVDYDDGQLEANQVAEVARHLNACPACSEELQALQDSLELAKDVWHEAASSVQDIHFVPAKRTPPVTPKRIAAFAACLALAVGLAVLLSTSRMRQAPRPSAQTQVYESLKVYSTRVSFCKC